VKSERLNQVDEIFQAALDLPSEQRSAYLNQACGGDADLRREVESLLSSHDRSADFMERPAIELDAAVIADELTDANAGESIGHYQVIELIGSGGMGNVYLAADERTGRKVALKLLPNELSKDQNRVQRFQQEARAVLALNHPNIVTIYEIGEVDGRHFIASEWIQGETLRQRMTTKSISLSESLDIVIQVGGALAAAHQQGIVHRDIKPENIMLRPDGYVKVLDFGIAKLTQIETASSEAPTALKVETAPGMVIGTVNYMSPEQARGLPVDQRTDIWSLGVVIYEMIAGCVPFAGETSGDAIVAILEKQPPPLARFTREAPEALEEIVSTALAKNRDERYQTATQMIAALRRLKQRLDVAAELQRTSTPVTEGGADLTPDRQRTGNSVSPQLTSVSNVSSAEFIAAQIKRHRAGAAVLFGLLVVLGAGLAYAMYKWIGSGRSTNSFQTLRLTRLTTSGKAVDATISPDGKYVAYINLDEGGRMSIWLRQVATSSNVKLADSGQMGMIGLPRGLTFSPDGNYLYYRARTEVPRGGGNVFALFRVPVLPGDPHKVIDSVYSPVGFSADGKRIAFVRNNKPVEGESYLMVANADGSEERVVDKHKISASFSSPGWPMGPVWSPDGKALVCAAGIYPSSLLEVRIDTGAEKPIGANRWAYIDHLAWLSDGSALMLTAQDESSARFQVWQVSYPSGEARRITNELGSYRGMSLTADSATMAVVQTVTHSDIWVMPSGKTAEARRITSGTGNDDGYHGLSWTPDGRIVYASSATGNLELWSIDAKGGNQKQLTSEAHQIVGPMATADGRYVVFFSNRNGSLNLWRVDADGSNLKQLTTAKISGRSASLSPDGKYIVYESAGGQATPALFRIGIDGGEPVQLTDDKYWTELPSFSPDGKQVAFQYFGQGQLARFGSIAAEGGQTTQLPQLPQRVYRRLRWTPDGSAIAYIDDRTGTRNVWAVPVGGGEPKQLTDFKADELFDFDWSRDGKQLAVARGTEISDVVLINNFR
jgi:eukaryotic-like serine/threonine-protein kinase